MLMENKQLGFKKKNLFIYYDMHYRSKFRIFLSQYQKYGISCPNYAVHAPDTHITIPISSPNTTKILRIQDSISVRELYKRVAIIFSIPHYQFKMYAMSKNRDIYLQRGDFFRRHQTVCSQN